MHPQTNAPQSAALPAPSLAGAMDRRAHKRFGVARPGKVFRPSGRQYVPAASRDLSYAGALLEIETDRPFETGETIDVALALTPKAIVPSSSLLRAVVVRSHAIGEHRQLVAVRYLYREALQAAA